MSRVKPGINARRSTKKKAGQRRTQDRRDGAGNEVTGSLAYLRANAEAESCAKDPERLRGLLTAAMEKVNYVPRGPFAETWPYLMAMIRLIRAHHAEEYRDISAQHLHIVVAALIYFVSPNDVIPDTVPILGQLDDALVVRLAMKSVSADLDAFMAWETVKVY